MARVLVTGCAGFVASHLCDALVAAGHEVVGVDNLSTGQVRNINGQVDFHHGDIRNLELLKELTIGVDYVYHLAALARIQPSIRNPLEAHSVNIDGTLNVLEACRANKVQRVIFSSSSSLYEGDELPTNEDAWFDIKNPYTLQKATCEEYLKLYQKLYKLDYVAFRYFNVYGPRQLLEGTYAAVVGIFLQQRKQGKPLTLNGDGSKSRDFTHVHDVTAANILGMTLPAGVYNVGTGESVAIRDLADTISASQVYFPDAPGEARATQSDSTKLRSYGWEPTKRILDPEVMREMEAWL